MALFGKDEETTTETKKAAPRKKDRSDIVDSHAYKTLIRPRITEKAHVVLGFNKYIFQVDTEATKTSVKKAVESVYHVTVTAVNIVNVPSKKRNFGRVSGRKASFKKAIVTLKEGDVIELFQAE